MSFQSIVDSSRNCCDRHLDDELFVHMLQLFPRLISVKKSTRNCCLIFPITLFFLQICPRVGPHSVLPGREYAGVYSARGKEKEKRLDIEKKEGKRHSVTSNDAVDVELSVSRRRRRL